MQAASTPRHAPRHAVLILNSWYSLFRQGRSESAISVEACTMFASVNAWNVARG